MIKDTVRKHLTQVWLRLIYSTVWTKHCNLVKMSSCKKCISSLWPDYTERAVWQWSSSVWRLDLYHVKKFSTVRKVFIFIKSFSYLAANQNSTELKANVWDIPEHPLLSPRRRATIISKPLRLFFQVFLFDEQLKKSFWIIYGSVCHTLLFKKWFLEGCLS